MTGFKAQSLRGSCTNQILIKCRFLWRGENLSTREKTSQSREENQQTQPTMARVWKLNPMPHWWEAVAFTTTSPLLPN